MKGEERRGEEEEEALQSFEQEHAEGAQEAHTVEEAEKGNIHDIFILFWASEAGDTGSWRFLVGLVLRSEGEKMREAEGPFRRTERNIDPPPSSRPTLQPK